MDREVARQWDAWAQAHCKRFLDEVLSVAIAEALYRVRKEAKDSLQQQVAKLTAEIGELRAEVTLLRAVGNGTRRQTNGHHHAAPR